MRQKLFGFGMLAVVLLFIVASVAVPTLQALLRHERRRPAVRALARSRGLVYWVTLAAGLVVLFGALCITYRRVPKGAIPWRCVWPGALGATLAMGVVDYGFPLYLTNVSTLRIGTTVVFVLIALVWFYVLALIVLAGAVVNELRFERDERRGSASACRRGGDRDGGADQALRRRDRRRRPLVLGPRRRGHRLPGPERRGKTTTLRMILALARPTAGHATVKGRPYRELEQPGADRRREPRDRGRAPGPQRPRPPARARRDGLAAALARRRGPAARGARGGGQPARGQVLARHAPAPRARGHAARRPARC